MFERYCNSEVSIVIRESTRYTRQVLVLGSENNDHHWGSTYPSQRSKSTPRVIESHYGRRFCLMCFALADHGMARWPAPQAKALFTVDTRAPRQDHPPVWMCGAYPIRVG